MTDQVILNKTVNRFELNENGHIAFADIRMTDDVLYIDYVESPHPLRGTGAAGRLMQGIVTYANDHLLKIHPICGYAAAWIGKNGA